MQVTGFLKAGHVPSLFCAFLYFDMSFMIWVLLGPMAKTLVADFHLSDFQKGLLLAIPPLGGSLLRLVLGPLADYLRPKRAGIVGMLCTVIPLVLGWQFANSYGMLLVVGFLLGFAGASFAVALPLASRWYPPRYQGFALGIAGAGNSGTAFATLVVPLLLVSVGWQNIFGLALIPLTLTFIIFLIFAKDAPNQPAPKTLSDYTSVLNQSHTWLFCLLYTVTFGGFVGFCMFLNGYFEKQFEVSAKVAGYLTTVCVVSGSLLRPIGGFFSDRVGGVRMLLYIFSGLALCMVLLALVMDSLYLTVGVLFLAMSLFGMGNGSVFQLVPLRFPKEIGVLTGVVGAAGGFGGFLLNILLGSFKHWSGSFALGFVSFGILAAICACIMFTYRSQRIIEAKEKKISSDLATESTAITTTEPQPA